MGANEGTGSKTIRNGLPQMKGLKELSCWFSNEIVRYRYGRDETPKKMSLRLECVSIMRRLQSLPIFNHVRSLHTFRSQLRWA